MSDTLQFRVIPLHDTEEQWNRIPTFIPKKGEQIIYVPDSEHTYTRIKIGDGTTILKDLPFTIEHIVNEILRNSDEIYYLDGGVV